ncbi:DUF305 domain-containing protein [Arthrobacter sp. H14]|uniref:DUF305 domain-containing protein n=1 Tax=Arthrobacter sp. H14 TaxID=1312959 RepID=UPI0004BB7321|nr:DUF305 domain-containing protein [Arthrobacter sp. H14]
MVGRWAFAASAAIVLALTACGPTSEAPTQSNGSSGASMPVQANAGNNAADVRFALLMAGHHEQTIKLAEIVQEKDGVSQEIQSLALKIMSVHEPEHAQLEGMLRAWGKLDGDSGNQRSQTPATVEMKAMAGPEQIEELRAAAGNDASRLFLKLLIAHHEATIAVAEAELAKGSNAEAMALARTIAETQRQELDRIRSMLERYSSN